MYDAMLCGCDLRSSALKPAIMKLTIAIIALNEADRILSAIQSAQFADEVLVIDGGSSDDTVNLAVAAGARVVTNPWPGFVT